MKNYFEIFGFETQFKIDLDELEIKYFSFQSDFHPDRAGVEEIEKSIQINQAHKVLSDDFLRICYLLKLKGIDILTNEKAVKVDQETLQKVLELQEKIAEIDDLSEIKKMEEGLNNEIRILIAAAVKCYEINDLELAAQLAVKAKYLKKSLDDLKERKKKVK